jgi:DNA-binding NarL/FixJ family response regulator
MKGERILHADDSQIALGGLKSIIESWGVKDGHQIIGSADSVTEVERLLKQGLRPTVAFVDNSFPDVGDGERTAKIIREISSKTIIVSMSSDDGVTWGDYNLQKKFRSEDLVKFLTELQH